MPIILDQEIFWLYAMFIQQPFNKNTETKNDDERLAKASDWREPIWIRIAKSYLELNSISARRFLQAQE
jgi:hypothetical protein